MESFVILEELKQKYINDDQNFMEGFEALFLLYNEFADKYLTFTKFYMQMHFMAIPQMVKELHISRKILQFEQLMEFFVEGRKEGYFRSDTDIEMEATTFLGSVNLIFLNHFFEGEKKYPLKKKLKQLKKYWMEHFLSIKSEHV